jgi:hypothetical protein
MVKYQIDEMKERFGLEVNEEQRQLATLYWTAKMHYTPPRQRFITASDRCVSKTLSQLLSRCLKRIQAELKQVCARESKDFASGANRFWIVESTEEVLAKMERLDRRNAAQTVSSHDFTTLYTNLPHESLKEKLCWVIDKAFDAVEKELLAIYGEKTNWIKKPRKGTKTVSREQLKEMVCYLIDNMYIEHEGAVHRQEIGIPMGTDCAPFLANLYLFALEYEWMERQEQTEKGRKLLQRLGMQSRYIDDLLGLNENETIEEYKKDIYKGLVLKKENRQKNMTHFLDMKIIVNDGRFVIETYDKRDDFPFKTRSFPDCLGNICISKTHSVILGQLRRYKLTNTTYRTFIMRVRGLTNRLLAQSFEKERLEKKIERYYEENEVEIDSKYRVSKEKFVRDSFEKAEIEKVQREGQEGQKKQKRKRKRIVRR